MNAHEAKKAGRTVSILLAAVVVVILFMVTGCVHVADGFYPASPDTVHRVEARAEWAILGRELFIHTPHPTYFEADVSVAKERMRRVQITCEQYDKVVRWGVKFIELYRGRGILQSSSDSYYAGAWSVTQMFGGGRPQLGGPSTYARPPASVATH